MNERYIGYQPKLLLQRLLSADEWGNDLVGDTSRALLAPSEDVSSMVGSTPACECCGSTSSSKVMIDGHPYCIDAEWCALVWSKPATVGIDSYKSLNKMASIRL